MGFQFLLRMVLGYDFLTSRTETTAFIPFVLHFTSRILLIDTYSLESWLGGSESPWSA
jgi:hypothetical protein